MAKIAVDARFYGTEHTGLGRYTTNVLTHLPKYLKDHELFVLLRKKYFNTLNLPKNCTKVLADFPHYSVSEQIKLPQLLSSLSCELLYSFHFNVPLTSKVPFVVTIHDLIKSHFNSLDTTTRAPWLFHLKRLGYDLIIKHAVNASSSIIVPSNTVKNDILALFNADPTKIRPIPEAPDEIFRHYQDNDKTPGLPSEYLLYVGNAYPHKNLSVLLKTMRLLPNFNLVIVAKETPFLSRLLAKANKAQIQVMSNLSDSDLVSVYLHAKALVAPSLMEGYGLPGLEALMVGTPVIASNIPVYREVYADRVTYFDPTSVNDLVAAVKKIKKVKPLNFDRTWDDVARAIAGVINESCSSLR